MRVPLSWLAEYVDLTPGTTPEDVHEALVRVGLEEEEIHTFDLTGPIVVGQVLDFVEEPQKNGKTIRWCQVRVAPGDGDDAVRGIVCGAGNFFPGDKVVVTLPGAVLPGPFPIAARKTYGHVSDGMIASSRELGLGDDHDGILRLTTLGLDPEVGTDAIALLGLDDQAVEINVTPDRGYAFSIRGVAREYSHATGAAFRDPALTVSDPLAGALEGFSVSIDDQAPIRGRAGSSVFVTRVVRGVDATRPTPPWMVARLKLAGIRSISLLVDITNYVMLELGQPIHGYDFDALQGGIVVRRAAAGETIVTLDDATRTLHTEDLLITDSSGPIGLAGVMGGAATEMSAETTNVLIEAANFDPVSIARTARRHKLPSEASKRYERGVDPQIAVAAAARVAQLMVDLAGGVADTTGSVFSDIPDRQPIELPAGYVAGLVGFPIGADDEKQALAEIGATVEDGATVADGADAASAVLLVTPPSWRPDITDKSDLAEEVARIIGYDHIPAVLPVAPPGRGLTVSQKVRRRVANALAADGFTEVLAYPFVSAAQNDLFGAPDEAEVAGIKLANPLDGTVPFLRTSLLPGLLDIARRNLSRGFTDLALYELGSVFRPESGVDYGLVDLPGIEGRPDAETLAALEASIPRQPRHAALLALGNLIPKQPGQPAVAAGIADVLDAARVVAAASGVHLTVRQGTHKAFHPGRTAELFVGEQSVGFAGELLPQIAAELHLPRVVALAELDLDALTVAGSGVIEAEPVRAMPAATQDLSLLVDASVPAGDLLEVVRAGAGELLEDIHLVDDYRGAGVAEGAKSVTFALRFRAADRTLTAAEASEAKLAGAERAKEAFGATVRE